MKLIMSILVLLVSVRAHATQCSTMTGILSAATTKTPTYQVYLPNRPQYNASLTTNQTITDHDGMLSLFLLWNLLESGAYSEQHSRIYFKIAVTHLSRVVNFYRGSKTAEKFDDLLFEMKIARGRQKSFEPFLEPLGEFIGKYSRNHLYTVRLKYLFDKFERNTKRTPSDIFSDKYFAHTTNRPQAAMACIKFENEETQYAFLGDEVPPPQGNTRFAETTTDPDVEVAEMGDEIEFGTAREPGDGRFARDGEEDPRLNNNDYSSSNY